MPKPPVSEDPPDFSDLPFWRKALIVVSLEVRELSLPNKIVLGGILAALALAPLVPLAMPLWTQWKQDQTYHLALDSWKKGDFDTAGAAFREATKGSASVERWLEYARFATDSDQENAVEIWSRAASLDPQDAGMQAGHAKAILQSGKPAEVIAAITAMPESLREEPGLLIIRAEAFLQLGRKEQAETAFRHAAESISNPDESTTLPLAILGLKVGNPGERDAAQATLDELATSPDSRVRIAALSTIVDSGTGGEGWLAAAKDLAESDDAPFNDRLTAFQALLTAGVPDAADILSSLQSAAERDPAHGVRLVRALLETGNSDLASQWIEARSGEAFDVLARLSAETSLHAGDWKSLEIHLVDSGVADPELARNLLSAQSFRATRPDFALDRWNGAIRQIRESGELLDLAARIARHMEWDDAWIAARRRALELDPANLAAFEELAAYHKAQRDLPSMFAVINQRLAVEPGDSALRNSALLCRLVLAVGNIQTNLAEARELVRGNPGDPEFATTLALALYRADRLDEAAEVFGTMSPSALKDSERAIYYGTVLAALGRGPEAREFLNAAATSDDALFPEVVAFRARALEAASRQDGPPQTPAFGASGGNTSL